jgi:hypothetical protein
MFRTSLPESIILPDGTELFPVIGGYLKEKQFLTTTNAGIDINKNGWASDLGLSDRNIDKMVIAVARSRRLKYRCVKVISSNLRGKLDLYRQPYQPTHWVFVEG